MHSFNPKSNKGSSVQHPLVHTLPASRGADSPKNSSSSGCSSRQLPSKALLSSIQALGKSTKGHKIQILNHTGPFKKSSSSSTTPKFVGRSTLEKGYTSSSDGCFNNNFKSEEDEKLGHSVFGIRNGSKGVLSEQKQRVTAFQIGSVSQFQNPLATPEALEDEMAKGQQIKNGYKLNKSNNQNKFEERVYEYEDKDANQASKSQFSKNQNDSALVSILESQNTTTRDKVIMDNNSKIQNKKLTVNSKSHNVRIFSDRFEPAHLKIEKGDVVNWRLEINQNEQCDDSRSSSSLYHQQQRMHVISFDTINEESNPIKLASQVYKLRFFDKGTFSYRCSIYTRMKGTIEVTDSYHNSKEHKFQPIIRPQTSFIEDATNFLMSRTGDVRGSRHHTQAKSRGHSPHRVGSERSLSATNNQHFDGKSTSEELSQRLIEVLDEEEDLRKSHQGDTDTPFIQQKFFKEIFESERGSMLKIHGTELSSGGASDDEDGKEEQDDDATDEEDWFRQQRVTTKLANILQTRLPLQPINESHSSKSRSISSANSSIEELKARGYKKFKARKPRKPDDEILEQLEETVKSEDDQQPVLETNLFLNNKEHKSPICFQKGTFQRLTEFSRMFNKNTNPCVKERATKSCTPSEGEFQAQEDTSDAGIQDTQKSERCHPENSQSLIQRQNTKPKTEYKLPDSVQSFSKENQSEYSYTSQHTATDMTDAMPMPMNQSSFLKKIQTKNKFESSLSTKCSENPTTPKASQVGRNETQTSIYMRSKLSGITGPLSMKKGVTNIDSKSVCSSQKLRESQNNVETDDQSELDEIAALQKQRQNQKKKLRKKNKKKQEQQQQQIKVLQNRISYLDLQVCSEMSEELRDNSDKVLCNMSKLSECLLENSINDEFLLNNIIEFLEERSNTQIIKSCESF